MVVRLVLVESGQLDELRRVHWSIVHPLGHWLGGEEAIVDAATTEEMGN